METPTFLGVHYKMWIEDGIFRVTIFADELTLKIAQEGVKVRLDMCEGIAYPMLSDCRRIKVLDKEVKQYLASPESATLLTAGALLMGNNVQKIAGNFFLLVNRPKIPYKVFASEAEALQWLQAYKTR